MIDLHCHTTNSDGTWTVEELLKKAQEINLEVLSITDHDSVKSYFEIQKNKELQNIFKGYMIMSSLFTALSNGKISALLSFIRTLVLIVVFVLLFVKLFGIDGLWYALPTAEFVSLIIGIIFVKKYKKVYNY